MPCILLSVCSSVVRTKIWESISDFPTLNYYNSKKPFSKIKIGNIAKTWRLSLSKGLGCRRTGKILENPSKMSSVWRWWVCGAACAALAVAGIRFRLRRIWGRAAPGAPNSLRGKTVLITGAASGLGLAAATELVTRGARVILACRDIDKGRSAVTDIRKGYPLGGELVCISLGLRYSCMLGDWDSFVISIMGFFIFHQYWI